MTEPTPKPLAPGLRERGGVELKHQAEYEAPWITIRSVAEKIGCSAEALWMRVRQAERNTGQMTRRHRRWVCRAC